MTGVEINRIARMVLKDAVKAFEDPKIRKEFEDWKRAKRMEKQKGEQRKL